MDSADNRVAKVHHTDGDYSFIVFEDDNTSDDGQVRVGAYGNDLQLFAGGSARILADSTGAVTMPAQPAFHVQPASLQANISNGGSPVTVIFGTETYDVGNNFASNTFTAPVTGKYLLCYSIYLQAIDTAADYYEGHIHTSNRGYYASTFDPDFADADFNYFSLTGSSIVDMDANDTAVVRITQSGGTAQSDVNIPSFFSGALIC